MVAGHPPLDDFLASLALPLRNLGTDQVVAPRELMDGRLFGTGDCLSRVQTHSPRVECSLLEFGGLPLLAGRVTPMDAWEQGSGSFSTTVCFGGRLSYRGGDHSIDVAQGDVFLNPRLGEQVSLDYVSSVNFPIEHRRLLRTLRAMQAGEITIDLERPYLLSADETRGAVGGPAALFAFFSYVDQLLLEGRHLPAALALDDQIHRLVALFFLCFSGSLERVQQHWSNRRTRWTPRVDDLIDYIRANAHRPLTLTDLEEQSNYSARHLQTLFRDRFDCSPMQFVRRQRLTLAMQKLQSAGPGDTVTCIARDCGYRHLPNFSNDFRCEFGINPSQVLRGAGRSAG